MIKQNTPPLRLVAGVFAFLGIVSIAFAQPTYADNVTAATGLQLTPATVNLNGDPGKRYTVNVKVTNVTTNPLKFTTDINDFGAKDETGAPSILLNSTQDLPTSIQTWVESTPSFILAPQEAKTVGVVIDVPADAEAGGHYGVIRFTGITETSGDGAVGQIASAGTLVLVRISGDIREDLTLTTFSAATPAGKETSNFEVGPLKLVERFTNTGNVHVHPVGQIEIRDTFGKQVATLKVNDSMGNVLPGGVRRFEQDFTQSFLFGHYTANLSIAYGTQGEAIVRTISFWVIPWKLVLIALLVILTLGYVLLQLLKRYNRYIVKRAKENEKAAKKKSKTKR